MRSVLFLHQGFLEALGGPRASFGAAAPAPASGSSLSNGAVSMTVNLDSVYQVYELQLVLWIVIRAILSVDVGVYTGHTGVMFWALLSTYRAPLPTPPKEENSAVDACV